MTRAINTALVHRNVDTDLILPVSQSTVVFDNTWNITAEIYRMFDAKFVPVSLPIEYRNSTHLDVSVPKAATETLESGERYVIRATAERGGKYYLIGVLKIHVEDN